MKNFLAVLVLALSVLFPAHAFAAALQARDSAGSVVTLLDGPCTNAKALEQLPKLNEILAQGGHEPVALEDVHAGTLVYEGKQYGACWARLGQVVAVMDDGSEGNSLFPVPLSAFQPVPAL